MITKFAKNEEIIVSLWGEGWGPKKIARSIGGISAACVTYGLIGRGFPSAYRRIGHKYDYDEIIRFISAGPKFNGEVCDRFDISTAALKHIYRSYMSYNEILRFVYGGRGGNGKRGNKINLGSFIIYVKGGQEIAAWDKINRSFNLGCIRKWQDIGRPLLGDKVHASGDGWAIKEGV